MSGKIFPSSAWSRCVAVWALIFAYLWALFTLNFIRFSKKRNKQLHIFRSQCSVSACIFNGFLQFLLPLSVWKLANPRVPILRRGGAEGLFSLPSFQNLKHVPLFSFPTYSSLKSCPLAEAVQQVNDLIFKKYWRSDPLDYQIVSKDFWGKTGKKSDSTPQITLPGGRWSNLTPKITPPGRSLVQFDPQDYPSGEVDTLIWPPKSYPRPGRYPNLTPKIISSTRSRVKNRGYFSFHGIQRSNLVPQIWESRRVRVKNGAHFSRSGDRARTPTRKCVAVGHSEDQSQSRFDTSKSKITLLEINPHPSLHSAIKSYLQEEEFLLVAKPFCTQKGTPFLLALSFTILDHLPNQQKSQIFFLIPTASSKNPLKIHCITIRYTSDLSLFPSCSCKDFNMQSEAIVWRRDS